MQDIRHSIRVLLKTPVTTSVMLLILGVGIGANSAIFSLVNALYWKPVAVKEPDQIVKIFAKGVRAYGAGFSYPEYASLRDHNTSFSSLAAEARVAQLHVISGGEAREARGSFVSGNYFSTLGLRPLRGRFFYPREDTVPDRDAVVVISAEMWKSRFRSDPGVLGRQLIINRVPLEIIGVAPLKFAGIHPGNPEELWLPQAMLHLHGYGCPQLNECTIFDDLIGRLEPPHTRRDAQDELSRIVSWSATDWAQSEHQRQIATFPATGVDPDQRAELGAQMRLLMCVAAVLLLVSCANLAGLFLARSVARAREIAIRLSIGASRFRIARQLLTESLLLAAGGCTLGLGFALWGRNVLASFYNVDEEGFRHAYNVGLDWRVLAFSFAAATISGILFGLAPALRATRVDLVTQLKEGAGAAGVQHGSWLRKALVAGQIALSLVLLAAAGLMIRSSRALMRGTNFDPDHVALLRVRPELLHYTAKQNEEIFRQLPERLKSLSSVDAVTWVRGGEGAIWDWQSGREVNVKIPGTPGQGSPVRHHDIGLNFFSTLGMPLLEGRDFTAHDDANAPFVAIVNQTLARQLWPNSSVLGRNIVVNGKSVQIVGVAADNQPANALEPLAPYLFMPFWQSDPGKEGDLRLAIRVKSEPETALPQIRSLVHAIDPNIPIGEDMSMLQQMKSAYMPVMLSRTVISYCGIIALCLSAVGLFSVLTYYVRTRTREIGIRMALGAQVASVLRLIISQGMAMSLAGVAAGMLLALGATRLLGAWLYEVHALDAITFAVSAVLLFAVAIAASYLPARRAAEVDPIIALRQE